MNVVDLGLLLEEGEGTNTPLRVLTGADVTVELLNLAAQGTWEGAASTGIERTFLALEGFATVHLDGTRRTLSSGFLVHVPEGSAISVHNETKMTYRALLTTTKCLKPGESAGDSE